VAQYPPCCSAGGERSGRDRQTRYKQHRPGGSQYSRRDAGSGARHYDCGSKRRGLSAESVLRCALLKQQRQLNYEELVFQLEDSAAFRAVARFPLAWSPKKSVPHQTIGAIRAESGGATAGARDRLQPRTGQGAPAPSRADCRRSGHPGRAASGRPSAGRDRRDGGRALARRGRPLFAADRARHRPERAPGPQRPGAAGQRKARQPVRAARRHHPQELAPAKAGAAVKFSTDTSSTWSPARAA